MLSDHTIASRRNSRCVPGLQPPPRYGDPNLRSNIVAPQVAKAVGLDRVAIEATSEAA
jgi:hypothetical protein